MSYPPTEPAPRCEAHDGAHALYLGACIALGAQVRRPLRWHARPVPCEECGAEQDAVKLPSGRVVLLSAGTDRPHVHPPPVRVEFDEDRLAEAIVRASRAAREERRPEAPPPAPGGPAAPGRPASPDGGILERYSE